jgi:mitogen-activated protein kinase kinase kinase 11
VCTGLQGVCPPLPDGTPAALASLLARCWAVAPLRPSFLALMDELPQLLGSLTTQEQEWLDDPEGHAVVYPPEPTALVPNASYGSLPRSRLPSMDELCEAAPAPRATAAEQVWAVSVSGDSVESRPPSASRPATGSRLKRSSPSMR